MRRFYAEASVDDGGAVLLDGRPVRTPARAPLRASSDALARAIAAEWAGQAEEVRPETMPLTGLANAAIDRVLPSPGPFADDLARYGETDLLAYRASEPALIAGRQAASWDPILGWAARRFDVSFTPTTGILHRPQPAATVERLAAAVRALDGWTLAGLSPLVRIGGSLVTALAVLEGAIDAADGFAATELDGDWQAEQWGEDSLARAARDDRERAFMAAAQFLALLGHPARMGGS